MREPEALPMPADQTKPPGYCYVIAEIGVNHDGDLDTAKRLIDASVAVGADAAKFQHFSPSKLVTATAAKAAYQKRHDDSSTQSEMLKKLALSDDDLEQLYNYCKHVGIDFLCTPFDLDALALLEQLGVDAIKIGSGDLTYDRLLARAAGSAIPVILSTGMATVDEVAHAVATIQTSRPSVGLGAKHFPALTLLHCTSAYPTPDKDVNLLAMRSMADQFDLPVGYSDHTSGILVPTLAAAMGASMIEKHITLDRSAIGPDHEASLDPPAFEAMVKQIRITSEILGDGVKTPRQIEQETRGVARRSLHLKHAVAEGHVLDASDLVALRPGIGIAPSRELEVLGKRINTQLPALTMLLEEHLTE